MKKIIVVLLGLVVGFFAYQYFVPENVEPKPQTKENTTPKYEGPIPPAPEGPHPEWLTLIGGAAPGNGKHIVFVSGDEEYRSEEALPLLAEILNKQHGFTTTMLFAQDPETPGKVDPNYLNNIPGLKLLEDADLMVIFTRFRELPDDQMQYIEDFLKAGKPVIGIRTATHAFNIKTEGSKWAKYGNFYDGSDEAWKDGFGRLVLGEKWISHHGHHKEQSTRGRIAPGAAGHPITNGIADGSIWGPTDVYGVRMPIPGAKNIFLGEVVNRAGERDDNDPFYGMKESDSEVAKENPVREESGNPNDPMMPVAWVREYQVPGGDPGNAFASTVGSSTDMADEEVRRMYVNAAYWLLDIDVPEKASVNLERPYNPSPYAFHKDIHWDYKNIWIANIKKEILGR